MHVFFRYRFDPPFGRSIFAE